MARAWHPTPDAEATVLAVVQRAQKRLPDRDSPLRDRLFALECAARGGRAVALAIERYRPALQEAEWTTPGSPMFRTLLSSDKH